MNKKYNKFVNDASKTKQRKTDGYCEKIKDALSKIDYSLAEKYKNAINNNKGKRSIACTLTNTSR